MGLRLILVGSLFFLASGVSIAKVKTNTLPLLVDVPGTADKKPIRHYVGFGLSLLNEYSPNDGALFGFNPNIGAKGISWWVLSPQWIVELNLGYFFNQHREADSSFTKHSLILESSLLWTIHHRDRFGIRMGPTAQGFLQLHQVAIGGSSQVQPLAFDAGAGGKVIFDFNQNRARHFYLDLGSSFSLNQSWYIQLGLGYLFPW